MGLTVTPGQFTFAGGEASREMAGRVDLQAYYNSVLRIQNMEVDATGQVRFRGGFSYVSGTLSNSPGILVPFVFSAVQAYILELTALKMRVYKDRALLTGGSLPVTTPWPADVLYELRYDQDADVMIVCHGSYQPQKITRTGHTAWTCAPVDFIDGPWLAVNLTATTMHISGTGSSSVTLHASAAVFAATDVGRLVRWRDNSSVWHWYKITAFTSSTQVTADRGSSATPSGTTATTNWRLGAFSNTTGWPVAVQFYENRAVYLKDQTIYGSKGAESAVDYDTFTPGTEADDAFTYTLPGGNTGRWLQETQAFLAIGTYGGVRRATGGGSDDPITPSSVSVKTISEVGVANVQPILADRNVIYVSRDERTVSSLEYDALNESYVSRNRTVVSPHVTRAGVLQQSAQLGGNNRIWQTLKNGALAGLTFLPEQQVYAWHSHFSDGEILSVANIPNVAGGDDETWWMVKRTLNGTTQYCVECRGEPVIYPELEDFFTDELSEDADMEAYLAALYEAQKKAIHLDCALTYDGRLAASLTLSSAAVGTGRTITASASVFSSGMVGRQITGAPLGRAIITGYTSGTVVTAQVVTEFEATTLAQNEWYLTAQNLSGLTHLASMTVDAIADGQHIADIEVDGSGNVDLGEQYTMVHVGLKYEGLLVSNLLEGGSQIGTSQGKPKNVSELVMRFLNTSGPWVGTQLYNVGNIKGLQRCNFPKNKAKLNWATPLFTGDYSLPVGDDWSGNKRWYLHQRAPLPCILQMVVPRFQNIDQ